MRKVFVALSLLIATGVSCVFAIDVNELQRYTINGVVYDENSEPMAGVAVVIVGTTIGAGTNSNGEFSIVVNDVSNLHLRVTFMGYEPQDIAVGQNYSKKIEIHLVPAENQLSEVVVTGTRVERPLKEVPVLTRVIAPKEIEVLNPPDIETLLQYQLPGLQIGYNSMSQMPSITYQGVGGEYLLFLVDGERVSGEGSDHNVDFSRFNIDDIERIEVIRGSQSTMYGSNALGGVINIITKQATRPFSGNISARYAGVNGQKYSASVGTKRNRFSSLTNITYHTKNTYTIEDSKGKTISVVNPDGTTSEEESEVLSTTVYGYKIWNLSQKIGYSFTDKLSANIKGSFYHNERDRRNNYKYQDFFIDYTINGNVKYLPKENHQITLSYSYDNYKKNKDFFEAGFRRTDYRNRTQTVRLDYSAKLGAHNINAGVEGNFEYLKHYMMKDSADATKNTVALYLLEDWQIFSKLNVTAGLRGDYSGKYNWHVTPKFSLMYHPIEILALRMGFSQGFRSPSLKELYQEYDMGGLGWLMLYGNPDLKPETSNQYSLSAELTKGGFNVSVSSYHNRYRDKIAYASTGDGSSDLRYVNAENSKTTGVETIFQWRMKNGLTLSGSYAYVNDYEEVEGKNTSSVRPHSISLGTIYTHRFGKVMTSFSMNGHWSSHLSTYTFTTSGGYEKQSYKARTLCTLNMEAKLPHGINLSLGVDNLFNYKDKASDSSLQLPQKGISLIGTLKINLADMFNL